MGNKKETGIIFVKETSNYNEMIEVMFFDILHQNNVYEVEEDTHTNNYILQILKSYKFRNLTKNKFDFLYSKQYRLPLLIKKLSEEYDRIIVIFLNSSFMYSRMPVGLLRKIKQNYLGVYYVLYYIDSHNKIQARYANTLVDEGIFDLVYSYEENNNNNFIFWNTPYSAIDITHNIVNKDIYFCGANKNRAKILSNILKKCKNNNVIYDVDLVLDEGKIFDLQEYNVNIRTISQGFWPYKELLKNILESNCILEIVQEGQLGLTLRAYEAVIYNKKLLTNNKSILDFKYYDPRYMQYFICTDDIDWDWVKKKEAVSYAYKDDFSSNMLLKDIMKRIDNLENINHKEF